LQPIQEGFERFLHRPPVAYPGFAEYGEFRTGHPDFINGTLQLIAKHEPYSSVAHGDIVDRVLSLVAPFQVRRAVAHKHERPHNASKDRRKRVAHDVACWWSGYPFVSGPFDLSRDQT